MAKKSNNSNQEDLLALFNKYFGSIRIGSHIPYEPAQFNEEELRYLLKDYGIDKHIEVFKILSAIVPYFIESWGKSDDTIRVLEEINNQEIDLIKLALKLRTGNIGWVELRCNTGDKVKLTYLATVLQLGEVIIESMTNLSYGEEANDLKKFTKKKGKPYTKLPIQVLSTSILNFLNNETSLKSGDAVISNQQGRFIKEFLEFAKVLDPDATSVQDEEYIRTLLNNYRRNKSEGNS